MTRHRSPTNYLSIRCFAVLKSKDAMRVSFFLNEAVRNSVLARATTSQLDRSDFQSIMGSYEGAFSAEPAAGDHPRGGW